MHPPPPHLSLVALPETAASTLFGLYDVLGAAPADGRSAPPFRVEIVGEQAGPLRVAGGLPIEVQRGIDELASGAVVVVPAVVLGARGWAKGRYPRLVAWLQAMHDRGALLCSACSGIFLLAETGRFDGHDATVHFGYAREFGANYPQVPVHPERVLVIAGPRGELVSSGASTTWHDLALYLIARHAGATAAQAAARLYALQWHQEGLAPYIVFEGRTDHGDAAIVHAQQWLAAHFSQADAIDAAIARSRLAQRTFKRRFSAATGVAPVAYLQRLRVEEAKRRLERSELAVDEIARRVGYEDPAFFRRLFRRETGMAPAAYRKRFRVPDFAR